MSLSLNEVDALAKKAARGAGYSWGLAEEAGKAVRWLCAHDQDGCAALAAVLERFDGCDLAQVTPAADDWQARGGVLCPLITGAALSDRAHELRNGDIRIGAIAAPILLFPFAAYAAQCADAIVRLEWRDGMAVTDGMQLGLTGALGHEIAELKVRLGGRVANAVPLRQRAAPDEAACAVLNRYAQRTYAPATDASRRKGAGSDTPDND